MDKTTLPEGTKVPNHVALILDGNRRWARARGLSPWEGHRVGVEAVKKVIRASRELGIHTFTVWAFSTENWDRSQQEIDKIMELLMEAITETKKEAMKEGVRIIHLGRKDRLPKNVLIALTDVEKATKDNTEHVFNWALDYGGKDEIVRAVRAITKDQIPSTKIDEKLFESYLDTADQPYPYVDLFIRTSGEQRTSGLLPWQMTYAEMYWELDHLPDFSSEKLREAVLDYSRRRRRFGGNDVEEHLKYNPKLVADLEVKWRHKLDLGENERFRDLVIRYVKEHYGLSKDLAKEAGLSMAQALLYGQEEKWDEAKKSLEGLYAIVQKTLKLAFEPEVIARFEIDLWKGKTGEEGIRQYLAEKFRFSDLQASKSAHLAWLANGEIVKKNWDKARWYMEKYYRALKERVA